MNYKRLIRDIIVAILTVLLAYLSASCSFMWIKGTDNNPVIDNQGKVSVDSISFLKFRYHKNV